MAKQQKSSDAHDFEPTKQDVQTFARCLFPMIKAYYDSEEGQKEFAKWKERQLQNKTTEKS